MNDSEHTETQMNAAKLAVLDAPEARFVETREIAIAGIVLADNVRPSVSGIDELAQSLSANGQLQAVRAWELPTGAYRLVFGHRRLAAAQQLGWQRIRADIYEPPEADAKRAEDRALDEQFSENHSREPMSALDEARALRRRKLSGSVPLSNAELARQMGLTRSFVSTRLKTLERLDELAAKDQERDQHAQAGAEGESADCSAGADAGARGRVDGEMAPGAQDAERLSASRRVRLLDEVESGRLNISAAEAILALRDEDPEREDAEQQRLARSAIRGEWSVAKITAQATAAMASLAEADAHAAQQDAAALSGAEHAPDAPMTAYVQMVTAAEATPLPTLDLRELSDADVQRILLFAALRQNMDRELAEYLEEVHDCPREMQWCYVAGLDDEQFARMQRIIAVRYATAAHRYHDLPDDLKDALAADPEHPATMTGPKTLLALPVVEMPPAPTYDEDDAYEDEAYPACGADAGDGSGGERREADEQRDNGAGDETADEDGAPRGAMLSGRADSGAGEW